MSVCEQSAITDLETAVYQPDKNSVTAKLGAVPVEAYLLGLMLGSSCDDVNCCGRRN